MINKIKEDLKKTKNILDKKVNKLREQEKEKEAPLQKQIGRESFRIGNRLIFGSPEQKSNFGNSLQLLTQALILADADEAAARRLLQLARRISRKK